MKSWWFSLSVPALLTASIPCAAGQSSAPISIQQSSDQNVARIIQEHSSVLSINHARTVTEGSTTVTEIVAIGPAPVPVIVQQTGAFNEAIAFQQGATPKLGLYQTGSRNVSRVVQNEIP